MSGSAAAAQQDRMTSVGVLVGLVLGVCIFAAAAHAVADFEPDKVGLGSNTTAAYPEAIDGHAPAGHMTAVHPLVAAAKSYRAAGHKVALWLGNSQLHGLNRPENGGEVAVAHAQRAATARNASLRYVQLSSPNMTYLDTLAMYLSFRHLGMVPDYVMVQLTYANFGDVNPRHHLNLATLQQLDYAGLRAIGGKGIGALQLQVQAAGEVELKEAAETPQQHLEAWLIRQLEAASASYRSRGKLSAMANVMWQSVVARVAGDMFKRGGLGVPAADDLKSQAAIDALISTARHDGVSVIIYRAPHRPGTSPFFYDRAGYDAKFAALAARGAAGEYHYLDLENLVPTADWGRTNEGRPDHFHFDRNGHLLLGQAMDAHLAGLTH